MSVGDKLRSALDLPTGAILRVGLMETAKPVVETFQMRNAAQRTPQPELVMLQQTLMERLYGN
jgi:hypothetical protein